MKTLCAVLMLTALVACGAKKEGMAEQTRKDIYAAAQGAIQKELAPASVTFPDVVPTAGDEKPGEVAIAKGDGGRYMIMGTFKVQQDGKASTGDYDMTVQFQDGHYVGKPDPLVDKISIEGNDLQWKTVSE